MRCISVDVPGEDGCGDGGHPVGAAAGPAEDLPGLRPFSLYRSTLTIVGVSGCPSARAPRLRCSYRRQHGFEQAIWMGSTATDGRRVGRGRGSGRGLAGARRCAGDERAGTRHCGLLGAGLPGASRERGGRATVGGDRPGSGERGHFAVPGSAVGLGRLERPAPQGCGGAGRDGRGRRRDRRRLRNQRGAQTPRRRATSVPGPARGRSPRAVSRAGRLVVPQQPRHTGRRAGRRCGPDTASARGRGLAGGRGGRPVAGACRGALSARRPGGRGARRYGPDVRVAPRTADCPAGAVSCPRTAAGRTAPGPLRPRARPRPPRPGCRRRDGRGSS